MPSKSLPLVSVVIPVRDGAAYIEHSIRSALDQTHGNIEIIVVDDGSVDETWSILQGLSSDITCVKQQATGVCAARNLGFSIAKGEWIQFLDSDDMLHPQKIEKSIEAANQSAQVSYVYAGYAAFVDSIYPEIARRGPNHHVYNCSDSLEHSLSASYLPAAGLFKREFLKQVGPWNEKLKRWVDLEYHARIAVSGVRFVTLSDSMYWYRNHGGQRISRQRRGDSYLRDSFVSLRATKNVLIANAGLTRFIGRYLAPFYLHLYFVAFLAGRTKFAVLCLKYSAAMRGSAMFHMKIGILLIFEKIIGRYPHYLIIRKYSNIN